MCDNNSNYSYKVTKTTTQSNSGNSNFLGFFKSKPSNGSTTVTTTTKTFINAERNCETIQNSQTSHTTHHNGATAKPPIASFRQLMLEHHNIIRHKHGANFMHLSSDLNDHAQEWADKLAKTNALHHRPGSKYGENIFQYTSSDPQAYPMADRVCEKFYEEMNGYPFGSASCNGAFNFTQMVWNDSIELGVGMTKAKDGSVYVVCNYSPRGNVIGEYNKNVFKAGQQRTMVNATPVVAPAASRPIPKSNFTFTSKPDKGASTAQKCGPTNSSLDDFRQVALNHHNKLRKKHGAPPMRLTDEINTYAQDWANTLASQNRFYHRPNGKYGENIYTSFSSDPNTQPSGEQAIQSFYDEIKDYRFGGEPNNFGQIGHFTQVVWDTSIELGVGMAKSSRGSYYVVCNYSPRGNMMGSFAQHVAKPIY